MALRICSFASGSKGNCIFVGSERASVLIDMGISMRRVRKNLCELGESDFRDILLTHTHSDHFMHVPKAVEKGAVLYFDQSLRYGVMSRIRGESVMTRGDFTIGDITVSPFPLSHDVPCVGYSLYSEGSKISVLTDLGRLPNSTLEAISDSDIVLLESNHDSAKLWANTRYTHELKARISGASGHLSNDSAAECAAYLAGKGVKTIILAHLSEENNSPELALSCTYSRLLRYNLEGKTRLIIAGQHERTEMVEA